MEKVQRLELFRPERKVRYVKDDTAVIRPDNRTPKATGPHQTIDERAGGQSEIKSLKKRLRKC